MEQVKLSSHNRMENVRTPPQIDQERYVRNYVLNDLSSNIRCEKFHIRVRKDAIEQIYGKNSTKE